MDRVFLKRAVSGAQKVAVSIVNDEESDIWVSNEVLQLRPILFRELEWVASVLNPFPFCRNKTLMISRSRKNRHLLRVAYLR